MLLRPRSSIRLTMAALCVALGAGEVFPEEGFEGLLSDNKRIQHEAMLELIKERQQTIVHLIKIVDSKQARTSNRHAVALAIELLGNLRAKEACGVLVDNIRFEEEPTDAGLGRLQEEVFPAQSALVEIGLPAFEELRRRLSWDVDQLMILTDYASVMLRIAPLQGHRVLGEFLRQDVEETPSVIEVRRSIGDLMTRISTFSSQEHEFASVPTAKPLTAGPQTESDQPQVFRTASLPSEQGRETPTVGATVGEEYSFVGAHEPLPNGGTSWGCLMISLAVGITVGVAGTWLLLRRRPR